MELVGTFLIRSVEAEWLMGEPIALKLDQCIEGEGWSPAEASKMLFTASEAERCALKLELDMAGECLKVTFEIFDASPPASAAPMHNGTDTPVSDLLLHDLRSIEQVGYVFGGGGVRERSKKYYASVASPSEGRVTYPQHEMKLQINEVLYEKLVQALLADKQPVFRIVTVERTA